MSLVLIFSKGIVSELPAKRFGVFIHFGFNTPSACCGVVYLSDDSVQEVPITAKVITNRLEKYEKAIDSINKQLFEPAPSDNKCPHCPHFFICPSGDLRGHRH